ncbi:hypothetical protein BEL04_08285 [Mucilaginibacter sp. PPCGB 2223]|uniref:hypothetical protein n=1 Tax=Mucilaginibacter sp. PPCGB 2223 TaxID=1886027 RepID=UPI000823FBF0|nr:hypothetical protein [Mucilaginibacter sp. PPCGB 2223]OCX54245.1 hypothetical protein BEL04_08285 [Mucilaginibacter sp. PPCGB 2223]
MSWTALAGNQCLSFNDLQDALNLGLFTGTGTSIPVSDRLVEKDQVTLYLQVDTSYSSFAARANNELIVKDDLQTALSTIDVFCVSDTSSGVFGWSSPADALNNYASGTIVTWTYSGTLAVGTYLTGDVVSGDFNGYYAYYNGTTMAWLQVEFYDGTNLVIDMGVEVSTMLHVVTDSIPPSLSAPPETAYISNAYTTLAPGVSVYADSGLTTLYLTFEQYIADLATGIIYHYSNGVVGVIWSNYVSCKMSDDYNAICGASEQTVYFPSFNDISTGMTLYLDAGMTTLANAAFVLDEVNNIIYAMSNGVVGGAAGSCPG